jgi:hypothetical protein
VISRSGILPILQDRLDHTIGRPRSLSVEGLLVAMQVNDLRRHEATVAEVARVMNSFTDKQRADLGIKTWKRSTMPVVFFGTTFASPQAPCGQPPRRRSCRTSRVGASDGRGVG